MMIKPVGRLDANLSKKNVVAEKAPSFTDKNLPEMKAVFNQDTFSNSKVKK